MASNMVSIKYVLSQYAFSPDAVRMLKNYEYIPGLHSDDPEDLILIYIKTPTRFDSGLEKKKKAYRIYSRKKLWAVIPPYIQHDHEDTYIMLEKVEFLKRYKKTLQYLEDNKRPNWENVLRHHNAIIKTIEASP